jgi:urea-proton symporter
MCAGVNIYAAAFLTPVGVVLYIAHGGLKASILAAWTHVTIVYACLCLFMFNVYGGGNEDLGSIAKVRPLRTPRV